MDRLFDVLGISGARRSWLHRWGRESAAQHLRGMRYMGRALEEAHAGLPRPARGAEPAVETGETAEDRGETLTPADGRAETEIPG